MGWARTFLLGDIGNRLDIQDAEQDLAGVKRSLVEASRKDRSRDELIGDLTTENAELKLCLAALVRLLTKKGVVTTDELKQLVEAIDSEDGKHDGAYSGEIV